MKRKNGRVLLQNELSLKPPTLPNHTPALFLLAGVGLHGRGEVVVNGGYHAATSEANVKEGVVMKLDRC